MIIQSLGISRAIIGNDGCGVSAQCNKPSLSRGEEWGEERRD